jgi:hypothetical protein
VKSQIQGEEGGCFEDLAVLIATAQQCGATIQFKFSKFQTKDLGILNADEFGHLTLSSVWAAKTASISRQSDILHLTSIRDKWLIIDK